MSKGSQTTTTQTGPPSYVNQAYKQLVANTQNLAQTPYTPYTGEGVAPVNPEQLAGIGGINNVAFEAQPYYGLAGGLVAGAADPLQPGQIMSYYNPFQQNVVQTTQEQFNEMNQMALNNIQGNAAAQGALGGNAAPIAKAAYYQGVLPGQEQTIAGLENMGYGQAVQLAMQQYQQNPEAAAYALGSLGTGAQAAGLQGAGAQISGGTLEQNTQQALDQYLYNQYLAQMGYLFALNQYATQNIGAIGSLAGGTSTTTGPPPSALAQLLGLGVAGVGAYGAYQGAQPKTTAERGGRIKGYQAGGSPVMPYAGGPSYIPTGAIVHGRGPPPPPGTQGGGASSIFGNAQNLASMGKMGQGIGSGLAGLGGGSAAVTPEAWGAAGTDLGTIGPGAAASGVDFMGGVADLGASIDAIGAGLGLSGDAAAALLPLALVQHGGRINYPGGLALPDKGRIQLPMRAGMGMPSFVKGYQEGGSPDFDREFADTLRQEQMTAKAYGIDPSNFSNPNAPVTVSPEGGFGELASLETPQPGARAYSATGTPLAFNNEQPTGSLQALPPDGGVGAGYPALPPRLPPSARPQTVPGQGGPGFLGMSPEFWSSMMTAGLGMMASAQPGVPAGVAIGRGALEGVGAYGSMKKGEADIEMQARKLDQAAQAEQDRIEHETQALQQQAELHREMTPYQKAELALKAQEPKTILGPDGQLHSVRKDPDTGGYIDIFTNQPLAGPVTPQGTPAAPQPQEGVPTSQAQGTKVASLGDVPDVPSTKAVMASGRTFNYGSGAPAVSKGMDIPEPADVGGHSAQSLKVDAEYYAATGKLPQLGYGGGSQVGMMNNQYRTAVKNYAAALTAARGIDPQTQAMMWREAPLYGRFVMGADGRATVSLGTAVRHLDLLQQLATAWQASDVQTINRVRTMLSREFGGNAATNLEAAGQIVGPEIVKAIGVAGAGTDAERRAAAAFAGPIAAPDQLLGAVQTVQGLLGGQLEGKMRQAKAAGLTDEQFKNLIGDRPFEILSHAGGQGKPPVITGQDKAALDWANANPNDPRAKQIKQRLGVP